MTVIGTERGYRLTRRSLAASLVLAGTLLVVAFRGVEWEPMLTTLRHGHLLNLIRAFFLLSISYAVRSLRWRVLLSAKQRMPRLIVFWATALGYLGNSFLPARAGEVIRSAMLGRATGVSTTFILATAFTERIVDAVALVCISLIAMTSLTTLPSWMLAADKLLVVGAFGGLGAILLAPHLAPVLRRVLAKLPLSAAVYGSVQKVLEELFFGVRSLQHPGRAALFLGLTALVWTLDATVIMVTASAFSLSISFIQALLLLAALGLSSAAPSTPGYIGIYQFVAVTILAPFGFSKAAALVLIIGFQGVSYAVVIVWGALGLWQLHRRWLHFNIPVAGKIAERQESVVACPSVDPATV